MADTGSRDDDAYRLIDPGAPMNALVAQTLNALRSRTTPSRHVTVEGAPPAHDGTDAAAAPWLYRSEGFAEDLDDSYATH
jgi:hypothetical protein